MPGSTKITVEKCEDGYRFFVYPLNGHNQELGCSAKSFPTYHECEEEKRKFISLVIAHSLKSEDERFVRIEAYTGKDTDVVRYRFWYFDEDGEPMFMKRKAYFQKKNCQKGIEAVFRVINEAK